MNIPAVNLPRVVIIGGGFGGLELAKRLRGQPYQVVLIDRHNYHTFQPLLYQVATAGLEPDSIAYPLRKVFKKQTNILFRMAEVSHIDPKAKLVHTSIGDLHYDYLVLATGSTTNFFGNEQLEFHSMAMKTVPESLDLRSLMLQNFEQALLTQDLNEREGLMNFVIAGGGPTGVELAGALAELKNHVLPNDYPDLDIRRMNIHLIEAAPRVLAAMSEEASAKAFKFLKQLGVQVWLDTRVSSYDGQHITTADPKVNFHTRSLIWAAGVKAEAMPGIPAETLVRGNRIKVDEFNKVAGLESVFALGDLAYMETKAWPQGHPMMAQPAIQQGQRLARNLVAEHKGKSWKAFQYNDKGSMATVGRNLAVVDLPNFKFQGFFAWFVWMFIHLVSLVGFRNKVIVLMNWAWSYLNFDRGIRLIIRPFHPKTKAKTPVRETSSTQA